MFFLIEFKHLEVQLGESRHMSTLIYKIECVRQSSMTSGVKQRLHFC